MGTTDATFVTRYLQASAQAMDAFGADADAVATMQAMAHCITDSLRAGGKLLVAGNGGSAADAQHLAGEFISRLMFDRAPLPALALTVDSSALTATANDYGYEHVFSRQVTALGTRGDVFLGLSTSGNSASVLRALEAARARGMATLGFTGRRGGAMAPLCDHLLRAPSDHTPVIQQVHITAVHIVCALVERAMFPDAAPD